MSGDEYLHPDECGHNASYFEKFWREQIAQEIEANCYCGGVPIVCTWCNAAAIARGGNRMIGTTYPCDAGTGWPVGYHHFEANQRGVVVCTRCGAFPKPAPLTTQVSP